MRSGAILRGCILTDEVKKEKDIIEERVSAKVEEILKSTEHNCNTLLSVFADEMHNKISQLEKYKESLNEEFSKEQKIIKESNLEKVNSLKEEYIDLVKKREIEMNNFISSTEESIKDLMLILFEKFFYSEYKNPENITTIIKEGLSQLEDSKNVQISLNTTLLSQFSEEYINKIKSESLTELNFTSHTHDSLLLELKSEQNNIEVDFKKQMEKIREVVYSF